MTHHPMRDAEIHVFERMESDGKGQKFISRFWPYSTYPIFGHGETKDEAVQQLEDIRADAIAKHEASFVARQKALEKARAARKAKKEISE